MKTAQQPNQSAAASTLVINPNPHSKKVLVTFTHEEWRNGLITVQAYNILEEADFLLIKNNLEKFLDSYFKNNLLIHIFNGEISLSKEDYLACFTEQYITQAEAETIYKLLGVEFGRGNSKFYPELLIDTLFPKQVPLPPRYLKFDSEGLLGEPVDALTNDLTLEDLPEEEQVGFDYAVEALAHFKSDLS
jgi:hypothetical protein